MKPILNHVMTLLLCLVLAACGGKDDTDAERARIGNIAQTPGATPFVARLAFDLRHADRLESVGFAIAARPGALSQPVAVTYERAWLDRRGAYDGAAQRLNLPVFGLYAGHRNEVTLTASFRDGSRHVARVTVETVAYQGPAAVFTTPEVRVARSAGAAPGFDYMMIKNGVAPPVVLDTDGQMRWAATGLDNSFSSLFAGDAFLVGSPTAPELHRVELDGSLSSVRLASPRYTNFHHELAPGKTGFLAELDAVDNGVLRYEDLLAEIDASGRVLKEWDLGRIFADYMRSKGDDPSNLVRPGLDWFHVNSAIYVPSDNSLLVSSREHFVAKLDYETGAIRWLLGDTSKHWYVNYPSLRALALRLTAGKAPIGQHSLSISSEGELLLFNNGLASLSQPPEVPRGANRSFSTPSRYAIDEQARTARETWTYEAGRELYSDICSSVYETTPGKFLVAYAALAARSQARLVGLDSAGQVAFDYAYPTAACRTVFIAQPIKLDGIVLR